jgi:pimeloyl-ACP methyl ester carboxylesterase
VIGHEARGAGTDLVLVHGVGLDRRMWDACVPALAERHRVTSVDLRGHADSPPAEPGVTLADLAGDVLEVLDRPAHLVGFSLGALVATEAALLRPEAVASLTLVSSVALRTPEETRAVTARLRTARADFPASVDAAIDRWFTPAWQAAAPETVARVRATLLANDLDSYLACYELFTTADAELWPRLPGIGVPTLAVTGGADPGSTPAMSAALASVIPQATSVVLPGARHLLAFEAPERLAAEIVRHTSEVDRVRSTTPAL